MFNYTFTDLNGHSHTAAFVNLFRSDNKDAVKYQVTDDHHFRYDINKAEFEHLAQLKKHFHTYVALLDDTDNDAGCYTVSFPDVNGAISEGEGITKALKAAKEVLEAILYDYDAQDRPLPKVHNIDEIRDKIKFNPKHMKLGYVTADMGEAAKIWQSVA